MRQTEEQFVQRFVGILTLPCDIVSVLSNLAKSDITRLTSNKAHSRLVDYLLSCSPGGSTGREVSPGVHCGPILWKGRLNVPERVEYKLAVMVPRCLENKAPRYLVNCCTPVADVGSRHRRSTNLHRLIVPRYRRIAHSVCRGPTVWNTLPVELREPTLSFGVH